MQLTETLFLRERGMFTWGEHSPGCRFTNITVPLPNYANVLKRLPEKLAKSAIKLRNSELSKFQTTSTCQGCCFANSVNIMLFANV